MDDRNNQNLIAIVILIFSFIFIIVAAAIFFYLFKRSLCNMGQILKRTILDCSRSGCCNKQARVELIYDVPDYYAVPPLPPRNEKPTTECDTEQTYCEIHDDDDDDGNKDESLRQQCAHEPRINDGIFPESSMLIPNLNASSIVNHTEPVHLHVDSEIMSDEAEVPEMQQNSSYLPSTNVSDLAVNPAYGTNVAIAPEILTEQNEAYEVRNSEMDNH